MKKILFFAPTAPSSGITQYIVNIMGYLIKNGIQVDILSFNNDRLKEIALAGGGKYYNLNISLYKHPVLYKRFLVDVFSQNYDAVHYHLSCITTLRIFKFAKLAGVKKIIVHSHNSSMGLTSNLRKTVFGTLHKVLAKKAVKYIDGFCACSYVAAEWMFGKEKAKNALIMKNAIDLDKFSYSESEKEKIKTSLNLENFKIIGNVGRFTYIKNHKFLVDILCEILKIKKDVKLLIIGEGELKDSILDYANSLGVSSNLVILGFREDIYKYYSAMDIFVLPSLFEGLPITVVEAQANGLKVIASSNVSPECNLTGNAEFYPLEKGAEFWCNIICQKLNEPRKNNTKALLKEKGYSLEAEVSNIISLY